MKRNIVFITIALFLITGVIIWSLIQKNEPQISIDTKGPADYTRTGLIEYITKTGGKEYERYSLTEDSPRNLIITYYQSERGTTPIERDRRGILVFQEQSSEEVKLLWESTEDIAIGIPMIGVRDVTGDGTKELLVLWQNGKFESLYIYRYLNGVFELLSPDFDFKWFDGHVTKEFVFNSIDSTIQVMDLDKDDIPEVWFPLDLEVTNYVAYKWNGSEYIRWKEQKEPFGEYRSFLDE